MDGLAERLTEVARYYLSIGLSVIPLGRDKKPAIKWAGHIEQPLDKWEFPGCNIALLTGQFNGLVVVDCDSEDSYIGWLKTKLQTPLRVKTKRGMQFYYRHPGQYIKSDSHIRDPSGFEYDVKGDRSYVVAPPSVRSGHQYQFVVCSSNIRGKLIPFRELPAFNPEWRPERLPACDSRQGHQSRDANGHGGNASENVWSNTHRVSGNRGTGAVHGHVGKISNGARYIEAIRAIEGAGGDKETFRAACKLIESGMSEHDALDALIQWNKTNADPPWTEHQLRYKIQRALQEAR